MRDDADLGSHAIEGFRPNGEPVSIPLISHIEGNLWMGGCRGGVWIPEDVAYVLSLYPWEEYVIPDWCSRVSARLYDAARMPDINLVEGLADLATKMRRGGKTLVHCQAGLNRSGLITALSLMRGDGMSAEDAISLLRKQRDPFVLCNPTFEEWLRSL